MIRLERVFGLVLAVEERSAGSFLDADISAGATTLVVEDASQFGEDASVVSPQALILRDEEGNEETVSCILVDPDTDTLTLASGTADAWTAEETEVLLSPEIVTRYAEVATTGAEDDAVTALVPSQCARYLSLGTRVDDDRERVTLEYESETQQWVVRDVYVDDPEDNPIEMFLGDLSDVDTSTVADGDALVFDETLGLWVPGSVTGSSGVDVEDDTTPVAMATTLDFGDGLTATDDGGGHVTVDATNSGVIVQEEDTDKVDPATTLDFDGSDFNVTDEGSGEARIALAYGTAAGTPAEGNHSHGGGGGGSAQDSRSSVYPIFTPSGDDDEFDDASFSGWTAVEDTSPVLTLTETNDVLSIYHPGGDAAAEFHAWMKSHTFSANDYIEAAIRLMTFDANFAGICGVIFADGTTWGSGGGVQVAGYWSPREQKWTMVKHSNYNSNTSIVSSATAGNNMSYGDMFLRLKYLGSNQWQLFASPDGVSWLTVIGTQTLTLSPTHGGFFVSGWGASTAAPTVYSYRYVRFGS